MSIKLSLLLGFGGFLCVLSNVSGLENLVPAAFRKAELVPDVLGRAPMEYIEIQFSSGKTVRLGNILTPTEVKDQPFVSWSADNDGLYTLLMVDPDVPSRDNPTEGDVFHWMVVNIPGCDLSRGQTVIEFLSSAPPRYVGFHRYTFLVFKQTRKIITNEYVPRLTLNGRTGTSTRQLISQWRLQTIAGNFYYAKWDKYAQRIRQLLGSE